MKNHHYHLGIVCGVASILLVSSSGLALADAVKVRVLAPDGGAVAGARVFVSQPTKRGAKTAPPLTATTDALGTASFDLQPLRKGSALYGNVTIIGPKRALEGGEIKAGDNEFRLKESRVLSGRVQDEAGNPVAGLRVALSGIYIGDFKAGEVRYLAIPTELEKEISATSDAQGNWRIEGVPTGSHADLRLDDERFASDGSYRQIEASDDNIVLTARPGAILEGRVVDEAGQAIEGVTVLGSGDTGSARGVTDAQGKYRITGLLGTEALTVAVMAQTDLDFVAPLLQKVSVAAKTTTQAPDLVVVPGIVMQGLVSDAATGKPLVGATVRAYVERAGQVAGSSTALSGADGRYRLRVLPGDVSVSGFHPDYSYRGPGSPNAPLKLVVKAGDTPKQNLALTPFVTLTGNAVDEAGKAVSGAKFRVGERWGVSPAITTDKVGAWSAKNVNGGTVYLSSIDNWLVVSPKQIKLPAKAPVKVVLRRATFESVKGRVVSPTGQPIAGATITLSSVEQGPGPNYVRQLPAVTSDKDGYYEFKTLISGHHPMQLVAKLDNYLLVSGPDYQGFNKQGAAWKVSDTVLAPFASPLKGRVLTAGGQPAIGAFVVADRGASGMVKTGEDGTFTLDKMIAGDLNVTAFAGNDSTSARASIADKTVAGAAGESLTLTLQPRSAPTPRDVAGAYEILAAVIADPESKNFYGRRQVPEILAPFDPELAQKLRVAAGIAAPGAPGAEPQQDAGSLWSEIVQSPEKAALRADEYLAKVEPRQKKAFSSYFGSTLGLMMVETDAPRAEELWQTSETTLRGMTPGERGGSLSETILAMALTSALASKLGKPSAATWPAFIDNVIETQYPDRGGMRPDIRRRVLVLAAKGTKENYAAYAATATPAIRAAALGESIRGIATSDLQTGLAMLDQIEALPDQKTNDEDDYSYGGNSKQQVFGRAALSLIPRLVKDDPEKALALARRIPAGPQRAQGLALAAGGQKAEARNAIFQEAFDATQNYGQGGAARVAALAFEVDPVFGKTLFDKLLVTLETQQGEGRGGDYETPEIAFYVARTDSATARRLLERTFAAQKASAQQEMSWQIARTAQAMAAVDLDRALEMSRSVSDENQRFQVQTAIAKYALASQAERGAVSFAELGSGSWRPGQAVEEQDETDD